MSKQAIPLKWAVVSLLVGPASVAGQAVDWSAVVREVQPSIVTIQAFDQAGQLRGTGTGFLIDPDGTLVTSHHVLRGARSATAVLPDQRRLPIRWVTGADQARDLLRVQVDGVETAFSPLSVAPERPQLGQPILVIGSPYGLDQTVSDGIVSAIRSHETLGPVLQFTAPVSPGSSGSPVLDISGRVVGVVTSQLRDGQNLNFAVAIESLVSLEPTPRVSFLQWASPPGTTRGPERRRAEVERRESPWSGHYFRVEIARPVPRVVTGRLGTVGVDDFTLLDSTGRSQTVPFATVRRMESFQGHDNRPVWIGALLFAVVGGVSGYWIAGKEAECDPADPFHDPRDCTDVRRLGIAQGVVGGGLIGGLIGAGVRREVWVEVPLRRVLAPAR